MGISFSNNWDTWAGINQCVVVTIWQRTIEDRDLDSGCQQPLQARAGHGDDWRGPRAPHILTVTNTHLQRPGAQLFILKWSGKCTPLFFINFHNY